MQGCLHVYVHPYGLALLSDVHLDFCLPIDYENLGDVEKGMSDWVLQKVKSLQHFVGGFGDGFEEELMPLFTAVEADWYWHNRGISSNKGGNGNSELRSLSCAAI